jgi:hypothetical protein
MQGVRGDRVKDQIASKIVVQLVVKLEADALG